MTLQGSVLRFWGLGLVWAPPTWQTCHPTQQPQLSPQWGRGQLAVTTLMFMSLSASGVSTMTARA